MRGGAKGTAFAFTSSEAGTAKLVLSRKAAGKRKGKACVKPTRKLRRAYSATLTITDAAGNRGAPVTKSFAVKPAPRRR